MLLLYLRSEGFRPEEYKVIIIIITITIIRAELRSVVTLIWRRIANSHSIFPVRLQRCFHKIRQYLEQVTCLVSIMMTWS